MAKKKVVKEVEGVDGRDMSPKTIEVVKPETPKPETTKQRAIRLGIISEPKVKGKPDAQSA